MKLLTVFFFLLCAAPVGAFETVGKSTVPYDNFNVEHSTEPIWTFCVAWFPPLNYYPETVQECKIELIGFEDGTVRWRKPKEK